MDAAQVERIIKTVTEQNMAIFRELIKHLCPNVQCVEEEADTNRELDIETMERLIVNEVDIVEEVGEETIMDEVQEVEDIQVSQPNNTNVEIKKEEGFEDIQVTQVSLPNCTNEEVKKGGGMENIQVAQVSQPYCTNEEMKKEEGIENIQVSQVSQPNYTNVEVKKEEGIKDLQVTQVSQPSSTNEEIKKGGGVDDKDPDEDVDEEEQEESMSLLCDEEIIPESSSPQHDLQDSNSPGKVRALQDVPSPSTQPDQIKQLSQPTQSFQIPRPSKHPAPLLDPGEPDVEKDSPPAQVPDFQPHVPDRHPDRLTRPSRIRHPPGRYKEYVL